MDAGGEIKIKRKIKSTKVGWHGARETANSLIDRSTGACVTHSGAALSLSAHKNLAERRGVSANALASCSAEASDDSSAWGKRATPQGKYLHNLNSR